jgi:hypothetical protein
MTRKGRACGPSIRHCYTVHGARFSRLRSSEPAFALRASAWQARPTYQARQTYLTHPTYATHQTHQTHPTYPTYPTRPTYPTYPAYAA